LVDLNAVVAAAAAAADLLVHGAGCKVVPLWVVCVCVSLRGDMSVLVCANRRD